MSNQTGAYIAKDRVYDADGPGLSGLLDLDIETEPLWRADDLPAIWRHQLTSGPPGPAGERQGPGGGLLAGCAGLTFGEVLSHPGPSPAELEFAFAGAGGSRSGIDRAGGAPAVISRALRCALAAAALLRTGRQLLAQSDLFAEIDWARSLTWLDETTRGLLDEAAAAVRVDPSSPGQSALPSEAETFPALPGYEIVGRLGEGGMGVVWRARHLATGRVLALKTMRGGALVSARARLRFGREAELASRLEHPNIARVYDSGAFAGNGFYAMELVEGLPLDQYVISNKLGRRDIARLMAQICQAIQHAHGRGVIHRDLKPSNVMVDGQGRPRVLDFGLAKAAETDSGSGEGGRAVLSLQLSLDGELGGTVAYMAPEQARSQPADSRSDVYALGAILYQLLTGRLPHDQSGSRWDVLGRVARGEMVRPRQANPSLDGELEAILLKATCCEPAARYGSASELAGDLGRYLSGEPLIARPPTLAYFAGRWARRRRLPLSIAAVVVVSLLGMAVWSFIWVDQARRSAEQASAAATAARKTEQAQRQLAETAKNDADQSAAQARADRARADEKSKVAERRLAESLVAQGDAMGTASRWVEAKELYHEAGRVLNASGEPLESSDLALMNAYRYAPPPLLRFPGRHGAVLATAIGADDHLAASGTADGTITLWDARTGREVSNFEAGGKHINSLAFSPDGKLLMSAGQDGQVALWDVPGRRQSRRLDNISDEPLFVAFSPDGKWCGAIGHLGGRAVWEVASGRMMHHVVYPENPQAGAYPAFAFTPASNGEPTRQLLAWSDQTFGLFELPGGRHVASAPLIDQPMSAAFSSDGRYLLVGQSRNAVLLDARALQLIHSFAGHTNPVYAVSFSPGGKLAYTASLDGTVRAWTLPDGALHHVVFGEGTPLQHVSFSSTGEYALSGSDDGVMSLWDLSGDRGAAPFDLGVEPYCGAISSDGRIALAGTNQAFEARDLATSKVLYRIVPPPAPEPRFAGVGAVALSPDGHKALYVTRAAGVHLLDLNDRADLVLPGTDVPLGNARAAAFSSDGKSVLVGTGNHLVVHDATSGRTLVTIDSDFTLTSGICLSRDGNLILAATTHGDAQGWNAATGKPVPTSRWLRNRRELWSNVAFSSDHRLALGSSEGRLIVWDAFTGKLLHSLDGHRGRIQSVAVSADDRLAATGGEDGVVKLWDFQGFRELRSFVGSAIERSIVYVGFSGDGRRVLSVGDDYLIQVFDLDRGARYRDFERALGQLRQTRTVGAEDDPHSLALIGEWYAFRGQWRWGTDLLRQARAGGQDVSPLTLGRCMWQCGDLPGARQEFFAARERAEAPADYLNWCIRAIDQTAAGQN